MTDIKMQSSTKNKSLSTENKQDHCGTGKLNGKI